jgi:hypothetical protein
MALMARTKLRIIIPLLQALLVILALATDPILSKRFVGRSDLDVAYVNTPLHLVLKLNFPLAILGLPVLYASFASSGSPPTGALGAVTFGVYDLAVLTSTAAFWYLVVVEVEMRKRETSCLRFSGRLLERLKAIVMILIGIGAAVYVLWDGYRQSAVLDQLTRNHNFWSVFVVDALIGGFFLLGWAAVLITMGVQDIVRVSDSR